MSLRPAPRQGWRPDDIRRCIEEAASVARQYSLRAEHHRVASTGVQKPQDQQPLASKLIIETVPADGSCLYHSLARLLELSDWDAKHGTIRNAREFREQIAQYFEQNSAKYNTREYLNTVRMALNPQNPEFVTFEEAVPAYAATIRGKQWGGDLEIDVASEMLGVIIHRFEAHGSDPVSEAKLVTSFFPDASLSDRNRTVTKWVLVWRQSHFQYARPDKPRGLAAPGPSAPPNPPNPPPPDESDDVRRRADFLRNHPRNQRNPGLLTTMEQKNRLLAELAQERKDRKSEMSEGVDSTTCYPAVTLTPEQRDQKASVELAHRLAAEERQLAEDKAIARRLSYVDLGW